MTKQNVNTIVNVALLIFVIYIFYKLWSYQNSQKSIEPFQSSNKMSYKSENPRLNAAANSTALGNAKANGDTSDIYANVPLSSVQGEKYQAGLFKSGNLDPSLFNLSKTDSDNHYDFASLAGLTKTAQANRPQKSSSAPEYQSTEDLLPAQDMNNGNSFDPLDPNNFMYDRQIFANLKPKSKSGSDYIRGDLDIKPIARDLFSVSADPSRDLTKGYFANYQDLEEETQFQDKIYTNLASGNKQPDPDVVNAAQSYAAQLSQPDIKFAKMIS